jgi:hypothetical protein
VNGRVLNGVVGSLYSPVVFEGEAIITGTLSAFVLNANLFNKFLTEATSALWLQLFDADGTDFHNIVMNQIKYTGDTLDPPKEGGVVQQLPFSAMVDPVTGTQFSWQTSNITIFSYSPRPTPENTGQSTIGSGPGAVDNYWKFNGTPAVVTGEFSANSAFSIAGTSSGGGLANGIGNLFALTYVIPTGVNATIATLSGNFTVDNFLDSIAVNGTKIDIGNFITLGGLLGTTTGFTSVTAYATANSTSPLSIESGSNPFTIPAGLLIVGTNTITFDVGTDGDNFDGLYVVWDP